ncbi:hypothetical protein DK54_3178 [Brucella abortus]|nr:hypothetical protein DK54_3178 [Brucella abortus]
MRNIIGSNKNIRNDRRKLRIIGIHAHINLISAFLRDCIRYQIDQKTLTKTAARSNAHTIILNTAPLHHRQLHMAKSILQVPCKLQAAFRQNNIPPFPLNQVITQIFGKNPQLMTDRARCNT